MKGILTHKESNTYKETMDKIMMYYKNVVHQGKMIDHKKREDLIEFNLRLRLLGGVQIPNYNTLLFVKGNILSDCNQSSYKISEASRNISIHILGHEGKKL